MYRHNRLLYKKIIFILFALICGCSHPETVIRDRYITLDPFVIHDTLPVFITDTVITGLKIVKSDTVALIKYLPGRKEFIYRIKTDTIKIKHTDTLRILRTVETKKDYDHYYYILGLLCVLSGIIYLTISRLKR